MAKRILSADGALVAHSQVPLANSAPHGRTGPPGFSVRTESRGAETRGGMMEAIQARWVEAQQIGSGAMLFDWDDRGALLREIAFVNKAQARLDEAAVKIAPTLLRIVLTVKQNLPGPKAQRNFLAEHLELDFRRISELCIVADSYHLLEPSKRQAGEREIAKYGWSKALKLAYVRGAEERRAIWERACQGRPVAPYRAILEEIGRFRERKLIGPPAELSAVHSRLGSAEQLFSAFAGLAHRLESREEVEDALRGLGKVRRELGKLQRALRDQLVTVEVDTMAANA